MKAALASAAGAYRAGWRRLVAGAREASHIGERPARDQARLFNVAAIWLLAIVASLAFLDGPLAWLAVASDNDLRGLFRTFTDLAKSDWMLFGSGLLVLILIPVLALDGRRMKAVAGAWIGLSAFTFAAVAGSGIAVNVLKVIFGRGRPRTMDDEGTFVMAPLTVDSDFASFPSGHATTAFAFAAVLSLVVPRARTGFLCLAAILALSRVVVGAHYPSDVIAGGLLGLSFTYGLAALFHRKGLVFAVRQEQWTLKAPRTLLWPLRRAMNREPLV